MANPLSFLGDILGAPFQALGSAAKLLHNPNYAEEEAQANDAFSRLQGQIGTPDENGIVWNDTLNPQQQRQKALLDLAKISPDYAKYALQETAPLSPLEELDAQLKRAQIGNIEADTSRKTRIRNIFSGQAPSVSSPVPINPNAPLSVRNNNPGNIRGSDGNFRQFASPDEGLQAMAADLAGKITGKSPIMRSRYGEGYTPTLQNVIETWAPPSENDTRNYVDVVARETGLDPNAPLSESDIQKILPSMIKMEGGEGAAQAFSVPNANDIPMPAGVHPNDVSSRTISYDNGVVQNQVSEAEKPVKMLEALAIEDPETYGAAAIKARADYNQSQGPDVKGEADLRKEFSGITKDFRDVRASYKRIESSEDNAAGDLSLIFGFMKVLDPGSTVREGEFATAQNAAGVPEQVRNAFNQTLNGERLSPAQRSQFKGQARSLYKSAKSTYDEQSEEYKDLAKQYGYKPERVVAQVKDDIENTSGSVNGWSIKKVGE